MSPTLKPTTRGAGLDAFTDSTAGQHTADPSLAPASTSAPGTDTHGTHAAGDTAADAGLNRPAGHRAHATAPGPLKAPGGQGTLPRPPVHV
jgi:hypothetical protein